MSVTGYLSVLRNTLEERRSCFHGGRSLKSYTVRTYISELLFRSTNMTSVSVVSMIQYGIQWYYSLEVSF
jgi:hypothetical protein